MGAAFNTMTLDGAKSIADVKAAFKAAQDDDRYRNGHEYSGGFGMCSGLDFVNRHFAGVDLAYDYVSDHADKWGPALCVLIVRPDGTRGWFIGAWCAE